MLVAAMNVINVCAIQILTIVAINIHPISGLRANMRWTHCLLVNNTEISYVKTDNKNANKKIKDPLNDMQQNED